MSDSLLEQLVQAVLYEGYILYPYRPSSRKNRRERFTFGRVYPQAYSIAQQGAEPCVMQTECLVQGGSEVPELEISVRFLQPLAREVGRLENSLPEWNPATEPRFQIVPELQAGKELYQTWLEAVERVIQIPRRELSGQALQSPTFPFSFPSTQSVEPIRAEQNEICGVLIRRNPALAGRVEITVRPLNARVSKVTIRVRNETPIPAAEIADPDAVILRTFASTHTVLRVSNGQFVSLLDPPDELKESAQACENIGTWPVLVGEGDKGERNLMLSSPIILYDYPQIAPESAGPLFDGTEIDELLTLRILTLTDNEKLEMRHVDEQARRVLERAEALTSEDLMRMHGVMRQPHTRGPIDFDDFFGVATPLQGVSVDGVYLRAGDRVRVRPKARADIMDLALHGQTAVIEAVEQDLEKRVHLAVVFDNDPGRDLGLLRQPGHRFFYGVDEVEPLGKGEP